MNDAIQALAPTLQSSQGRTDHFLCSAHQQLISKIEHLCRYSTVIQVVTGPQGSGKQLFVEHLANAFSTQEAVTVALKPNYETSERELLEAIFAALNATSSAAAPEPEIVSLEPQLRGLQKNRRFLLLIVENGETLNQAALHFLFQQLQLIDESIRPHIVIFGQPVLAEKARQQVSGLNSDSLCHFVDIPPYALTDTQAHLQHHFPEEAELLSAKRIEQIHLRAFGLPGLIEKALNKELTEPSQAKTSYNLSQSLTKSLLGILVLAVGGGAGYVLWNLYSQPGIDSEQVSINIPITLEASPAEESLPAAPILSKPIPPQPLETLATATETTSTTETTTDLVESPEAEIPVEATNDDNLAVADVVPAPMANQPEDHADSGEEPLPVLTTPANNKLVLQLKPAEPKSKTPATPPKADNLEQSKNPLESKSKTSSTAVEPLLIKPRHPLLREEELLSWNANGYTLQMLGARKESSVVNFIQSRPDRNQFYYFSTIYKEKPWYVVVYGQYQNRDEAVAAIRSLPSDLKKRKPWARSIKGVQDDIRRK